MDKSFRRNAWILLGLAMFNMSFGYNMSSDINYYLGIACLVASYIYLRLSQVL